MIRRDNGALPNVKAAKQSLLTNVGKIAGAAIIVAGFLFFAFTGVAKGLDKSTDAEQTQEQVEKQQELKSLHRKTILHKRAADRWGHKRGAHLHRAHGSTTWTESLDYAKYRERAWHRIAVKQRNATKKYLAEQRKWARANKDFHYALRLASRHYRVSYGWLHSCAHSEGHIHGYRYKNGVPQKWRGIDPFQMNHGGSGAGGWMQFMESTFNAYPQARKPIPKQYRKWNSKLAQAYTAAYVFKTEGSGQWTGPGC